jgi:hypothetical protein
MWERFGWLGWLGLGVVVVGGGTAAALHLANKKA